MKPSHVLRGGRLVLPSRTLEGDLLLQQGRIAGMAPAGQGSGGIVWDLEGRTVLPALIDSHFHGAWGIDVSRSDPEQIASLALPMARQGVTRFLPTVLPAPRDEMLESIRNAARACQLSPSALVGIHLEGPFIAKDRRGALPEAGIYPYDDELMEAILEAASGHLRVMTFAPEAISPENIQKLTSLGVALSIGHTCADAETTRTAIRAGVRRATHLCNAMPGIHHRSPGPMVPLLTDPNVRVELIVDGEHVDDSVIELVLRLKGSEGILAVSDAMPLAGVSLDEGRATGDFAGVTVSTDGSKATLQDGTLAGSVTLLWPALCRLKEALGLSLQDLGRFGSAVPAHDLPLSGLGRLQTGAPADLMVLGDDNQIELALRGGLRADSENQDSEDWSPAVRR